MHTQAYAQVDESLETGWRGALEQWMHCVAKKNPQTNPIFNVRQCFGMSSPEQNCHFRRTDYMALQLQSHNWKKHRGKKIQKAIITTRPSLSEAFIPLPSLPAMTPICLVAHLPCGSSKNGSQMWGWGGGVRCCHRDTEQLRGFLCPTIFINISQSALTFN